MAACFNYSRIAKFDKSSYDAVKRAIFYVSQKLGTGSICPVPYDTAWTARVPKTADLSSPEFPESLQWLRDHQRDDGSWGADNPSFLHSKILNTLASLSAFEEWNHPEDESRRKKGVETLRVLVKNLPQAKTNGLAFEMIISGLVEDANKLKMDIPYEKLKWHSKIGKEKLRDVQSQIISNKPSKYWSLLEATAETLDLEVECYRPEITRHGLIASQPSTTAFILRYARLRGDDFPQAEWALKKLCEENNGGMPHFSPSDDFEITYGLDFLLKVGINPRTNVKHAVIENALDVLRRKVDSNKEIGFSSNWPIPDEECSKTALSVLCQSSHVKQELACDTITEIKNRFAANSKSVSNSKLPADQNNNTKSNFEERAFVNQAFLSGKRNVSTLYNVLEEAVASDPHGTEAVNKIANFIEMSQNNDGGWGTQGRTSSIEETAYACLAIFHLVQKGSTILEHINFPKLVNFMENTPSFTNSEHFWCHKVNFNSSNMSKVASIVANYALFQIQRLCIMTDALNDNQLDTMRIDFFDENVQPLYQGNFILACPEVQRCDIEVSKKEVMNVMNIIHNILEVKPFDDYVQALVDESLEFSYLNHALHLSPYDRAIDVLHLIITFLLDDVFDIFLQEKNNLLQESNELMNMCCRILRGDFTNINEVPNLPFPNYSLILRYFFHIRTLAMERKWNVESHIKLFKSSLFRACIASYKLQCLGVELTPEAYEKISKWDIGVLHVPHQSSLLYDSTADSTEFETNELFLRYRDHACIAARLLADVPSALKDLRASRVDNYCIQLQREYKISLREGMMRTTKKANREILKMYALKKLILQDPEYRSDTRLLLCMKNVEYFIGGLFLWSINSPRYQLRWKISAKRFYHEKKDLKSVWDLCFDLNEP